MIRSRPVFVVLALIVMMLSSAWLGAAIALRRQARQEAQAPVPAPALVFLERLQRWERQASLTPEQRRAVSAALERARTEARELGGETARRAMEIRRRLRAEIDPLLTPAQRAELDRRPPFGPRGFLRGRPEGAGAAPGEGRGGPATP